MKKGILYIITTILLSLSACSDGFMDVTPKDLIIDEVVWQSRSGIEMFINDTYNSTLTGPLYNYTQFNGDVGGFRGHMAYFCTDDMGEARVGWNGFNFTSSNCPVNNRWEICYASIRKANLGLQKIPESTIISADDKKRFLGDMHFIRGLLYLELFRYYGGVPLITKVLDRHTENIFYSRGTAQETLQLILDDFQAAAEGLPIDIDAAEYGRATKGAALGMKAVAYLHGAGTVDEKYYADAAKTAKIFIDGELKTRYELFGKNAATAAEKREAFINLFLEQYEGNEEVIFDVQYAYPYKTQEGLQTIPAPGSPGPGHSYGWGRSAPSDNLARVFEMKDGSAFDWNNPAHAKDPFSGRDERFYGTFLYHGVYWKGDYLSLSSNRIENGIEITDNLPNGLFSSKSECTQTGYYIRKHMNEPVISGWDNQLGLGDGGNLIVLRLAEILLIYAEAQNESSGPDATVHEAVNRIRRRAGQPDLPTGLNKDQMREKIHNERRVELAFECKRLFDIMRWQKWNSGEKYLNQPLWGVNCRYEKDGSLTYTPFKVFEGRFVAPKNYLLPIPKAAIDRNPKLVNDQNPGW